MIVNQQHNIKGQLFITFTFEVVTYNVYVLMKRLHCVFQQYQSMLLKSMIIMNFRSYNQELPVYDIIQYQTSD